MFCVDVCAFMSVCMYTTLTCIHVELIQKLFDPCGLCVRMSVCVCACVCLCVHVFESQRIARSLCWERGVADRTMYALTGDSLWITWLAWQLGVSQETKAKWDFEIWGTTVLLFLPCQTWHRHYHHSAPSSWQTILGWHGNFFPYFFFFPLVSISRTVCKWLDYEGSAPEVHISFRRRGCFGKTLRGLWWRPRRWLARDDDVWPNDMSLRVHDKPTTLSWEYISRSLWPRNNSPGF